MNNYGQVTMEVMVGFGLFIIAFLAISSFVFLETNYQNNESDALGEKNVCFYLSQAFFETKNSKITWNGSIDYNTFVSHDTIYINYDPLIPFNGTYCETIDTNLQTTLKKGDANISYTYLGGYLIAQ
ncbi:MAG: hypothetical protein WCI04_02555 [archaeon]